MKRFDDFLMTIMIMRLLLLFLFIKKNTDAVC